MMNIQEQIFEDIMKKLGMAKNDQLICKAKEIYDLIAIKSSGVSATLNDCAKTILCIDISSEFLGIAFDKANGVKFSSMKKTMYNDRRNLLMKLMNLDKKLNINDFTLKMGVCNGNVEKAAKTIYETFQKDSANIDLDHPQYITMSVYQACKKEKVKVAKKEFIAASNLKLNQWCLMEKSWDKWISAIKFSSEEMRKKINENSTERPKLKRKLDAEPEIEDYDVWAKRTLEKARAELKNLKA